MRMKWTTGLVLVAAVLIAIGFYCITNRPADSDSPRENAGELESDDTKGAPSSVGISAGSGEHLASREGHEATVQHRQPTHVAAVTEDADVEEDPRISKIEGGVELADIPAALENLQSKGDEDNAELVVSLVRQWAEADIGQAARWVSTMPAGAARKQAFKDVAALLAETNAAGAVAWIKSLPDGEARDSAVISAAYEIVRTEPVLAMEMAVELPVSEEGDDLVKHTVLQWADIDPQAAAQWAEDLPDEMLKDRVQANIATAWGEKDPVNAAQYALLNMKPGRAQDDAVMAIVQRWAQKDPGAAADWVSHFPTGKLSETAAENVLKLWPDESPAESHADQRGGPAGLNTEYIWGIGDAPKAPIKIGGE